MSNLFGPRRWLAVVMLLAATLFACSQYDSEVGRSVVGGDVEGVVHDTLVPIDKATTYVFGDALKASTSRMAIGQRDGFASAIVLVMNSTGFGDSVHAFTSGQIVLKEAGFLDTTRANGSSTWRAIAYRIEEDFGDPFLLNYHTNMTLTPIDTVVAGTHTSSDSLVIDLDATTLQRWIADTLNHGLLLRPMAGEASFIRYYHPSRPGTDVRNPYMRVVADIETDGSLETDAVVEKRADFARYLTDDRILSDPNRMFVSRGFIRRMLVRGDISWLNPREVSVNQADLVVYRDTSWADGFGVVDTLKWRQIRADWGENPDTVYYGNRVAALTSAGYRNRFLREVTMDITSMVRFWVEYPDSNFGLSLEDYFERNAIGRAAYYDDGAADSLKPHIRIVYTDYSL